MVCEHGAGLPIHTGICRVCLCPNEFVVQSEYVFVLWNGVVLAGCGTVVVSVCL